MRGQEQLIGIRNKWTSFMGEIAAGNGQKSIFLTFSEAALIFGISTDELKALRGGGLGIEITENGLSITFVPGYNLTAEVYKVSAELLQLSAQSSAGKLIQGLRGDALKLSRLCKVSGFSDLLDSVEAGATPGQEQETTLQHLRVASWFYSLPAGLRTDLIPPERIFTRPG